MPLRKYGMLVLGLFWVVLGFVGLGLAILFEGGKRRRGWGGVDLG